MLLLNKKEKEELVIKLAKEGKTTRQIAEIVHISLKDIGAIIRKVTGDEGSNKETETIQIGKRQFKYGQAFRMFSENKPLTDAVIELGLNVEKVLDYYFDYLRITRNGEFIHIYNELKNDFSLFLYVYRRIKEEGLTRDDIKDLIGIQRSIGEMQNTVGWLNKHIPELMKEKEELEEEIFTLRMIKDSLENSEY